LDQETSPENFEGEGSWGEEKRGREGGGEGIPQDKIKIVQINFPFFS
jgi:hypothetical protein